MAKITSVKMDVKKAKDGVWVPFSEDIQLCIASVSNPDFRNERSRLLKPHQRLIRQKITTNEQIMDLLKPAYAKHILVGWKNIEDESGKKMAYSPEKALEYFKDPAYSYFFDFVVETATENETFRVEEIEDAEKN